MTEPYVMLASRLAAPTTLDGDTFGVTLQLLPDLDWRTRIRLDGYDTPEKRSPASPYEKRAAAGASVITRAFVTAPGDLWCQLAGTDSFGRTLAKVWHELDGIRTSLGEQLLDVGLATRWPTRWYQVYDPTRSLP